MQTSPSKRIRDNDWRLFLRLLPYVGRNRKVFFFAILMLIPLSLSGTVQPLIIGQSISLLNGERACPLIGQQDNACSFLQGLSLGDGINLLIGLFLASTIVRLFLEASQGYLIQKVGQEITAQIREDLFTHVTSLAVRFFDRTPVGKLVTRISNDVEALGEVFASGAVGVFGDLLQIAVIAVAMFRLQWQMALMLVLMLVPIAALIIYFQQQYRKANYEAREELSKLNSMLQENITGINVVQMFRRELYNGELFRKTNDLYRRQVDKTIFHDSAVSATLEWISFIAVGGVLWVGGNQIMGKSIDIGTFTAFIIFAQRLFNPLRQFADKFTMFQAGFTAIERISELSEEPIEIKDIDGGDRLEMKSHSGRSQGEICFENVSFAYKDDEYVLKNLNFTIKSGEKVALVGPTGAGKSSIIRLLCRLYEPTQGRILVDGIDIRYIPQAELRRYIGVILQDSFLFAGDIQRNITLGESYSFDEVERAAKATNIDRFIDRLPQGYATELRQRGMNLSAGEKQLLAFARVAIREPNILVLDEATANLDVGTEALIQEALDRLLIGKTAIIIAHRLSTISNVDKILVLKRGELIEAGSHEELIEMGGLYASLYELQMLGN
jgi:ATP-binding cassette, subfamily B, multidrug efflux pump